MKHKYTEWLKEANRYCRRRTLSEPPEALQTRASVSLIEACVSALTLLEKKGLSKTSAARKLREALGVETGK